MKPFAMILTLLLAMLRTSAALACANCIAASSQRTIAAYYASTMLLSLMPFALIGGIVGAVYLMGRRQRARADSLR